MSDIFEFLEAQAQEENLPFKSAAVVAIDRAERRFNSFLASAQGTKEFDARIALLQDEIARIATDVCEEYGYDDPSHIARLVVGQMQVSAGGTDPTKGLAEHQELPVQDPKGYYTQQSGPAMNPNSAGDNMKNTNPPIPELTPDESQNPVDKAWPWDGPLPDQERMDMSRGKAKSSSQKEAAGRDTYESLLEMDEPSPEELEMIPPESLVSDEELEALTEDETRDDLDALEEDDEDVNMMKKRSPEYGFDAFGSAERMDLDNLASVMRPSEAIEYLVNDGMPIHEAQTRVDEYVNHLNPGWASKHWKANYEINPMESEDDVHPGINDVEMMNLAGRPSAESAAELYREMAVAPEQKNDFVNMLTRYWTEHYEQMDPQAIAQMVQSGVSQSAGMMTPAMASVKKEADMPDHKFYRDLSGWLEWMLQGSIDEETGQPMTDQARAFYTDLKRKVDAKADRLENEYDSQWSEGPRVENQQSQRGLVRQPVVGAAESEEEVEEDKTQPGGHTLRKKVKKYYEDPKNPPSQPRGGAKAKFKELDERGRPRMQLPEGRRKKGGFSDIVSSALENIEKNKK